MYFCWRLSYNAVEDIYSRISEGVSYLEVLVNEQSYISLFEAFLIRDKDVLPQYDLQKNFQNL